LIAFFGSIASFLHVIGQTKKAAGEVGDGSFGFRDPVVIAFDGYVSFGK